MQILNAVIGLTLLGSGSVGSVGSGHHGGTTTPVATHEIEIVGLDYAFRAPAEAPAGLTTIRFVNAGKVAHELNISLLKTGVTVQQFIDAANGGAPRNALREATVGVLLAAPGKPATARLVTDLLPGRTYVLMCINKDDPAAKPHFAMGMFSAITVASRPAASVPITHVNAHADTHVDTIVGSDYTYRYPRTVTAGRHLFAFTNAGSVRHEFVMLLLKKGVTVQQLIDAQKAGSDPGPLVDDAIGVLHSPAGTSPVGLLDVDMLPGRDYAIICTFANDDKSPPHFMLGMLGDVRVTGQATR